MISFSFETLSVKSNDQLFDENLRKFPQYSEIVLDFRVQTQHFGDELDLQIWENPFSQLRHRLHDSIFS